MTSIAMTRSAQGHLRARVLPWFLASLVLVAAGTARAQNVNSKYLSSPNYLTENTYIMSPGNLFFLWLGNQGNMCLYGGSNTAAPTAQIWCTNTGNNPVGEFWAQMQTDANFCIYKGRPWANYGLVWCSGSTKTSGQYSAQVTDDGRLQIMNASTPTAAGATAVWTHAPWSPAQVNTYLLGLTKPLKSSDELNNNSRLMIQTTATFCTIGTSIGPTPLYLNMVDNTTYRTPTASEVPAQRQFNNMFLVETVGTACGAKTFRLKNPKGQYLTHATEGCGTSSVSYTSDVNAADRYYIVTENGATKLFYDDGRAGNCKSAYTRLYAEGLYIGGQGYCGSSQDGRNSVLRWGGCNGQATHPNISASIFVFNYFP